MLVFTLRERAIALRVERFGALESDDSTFSPAGLLSQPGMWIADGTRPGNTSGEFIEYTVPADPEQLDELLRRLDLRAAAAPSSSVWTRVAFVAVNVLLIVALGGYWWRRRKESAAV